MIIRKTLREQVVEILRHKILSGEIKPGERIIEAKVAEELKVSRGPLREALRQIEEEGLVVYEAQKGCVVKTMTYEEMQETYLIQSTLEKLAVQMCGGELSKEQDEEMQKLVLSMEKAANQKNLYDVIKFDEQFHECIVKTAHSEKLHRIWKILEGGNTAAMVLDYMTGAYSLLRSSYLDMQYGEKQEYIFTVTQKGRNTWSIGDEELNGFIERILELDKL